LIHRVVLVLAAFSLFSTLLAASGPTVRWRFLGVLLALGVCALVAVIVCGFTIRTMRSFGRAETVLLVVALGALALWTIANILNYTPYRSDEEIFVQYSANLLRHGHNPYGADMMPAYAQYPSPFPTKLLDGSITHSLDYPALPTLLTTLLTIIVGDFHTVALLCTLALFTAALVMFRLLPRGLRSLAPLLVVGIPVLASGSSGGLLFTLVVAPLAFTAYRWQHTGEGGRLSRTDLAKAAAVGIAVSTTQVAWFPIPFLFLGIYLKRERELGRRAALKVTGKFTGLALLAFFLINAVFIFWGPKAWLHGVLAPVTQHAVPEGQGLINLIQSLSIGSGNLSLYTYAGALVMIGLLVAYWRHFDRLGAACFALPLVGLLFPARSYWTYFIAYGAAWMVELLSHDPEPEEDPTSPKPPRVPLTTRLPWLTKSGTITAAAFVPAAVVLGAALLSPQPLGITVTGSVTTAQLASVQEVRLTVANHSGRDLTPHFMAVHGDGLVSAAWNVVSGPATLPAHSQADYVIAAASLGSMPPLRGGLKIQAVTDQPATISFSRASQVQSRRTILSYQEPTTPLLSPDEPILLTARVQNEFGQPAATAGVRLCLAQVRFANSGGAEGIKDASIAAWPRGDRPDCGFTDATGQVRFTVAAHSTGGRQLYFQSYGQQGGYGTFGYSEFVTASWR
jgi:uncharacterized membrane protein